MSDSEYLKLGPTGKFPLGKIGTDDEGELAIGITTDGESKNVIIHFGTAISWVGLPPDQAESLAHLLLKHANLLREGGNDASIDASTVHS